MPRNAQKLGRRIGDIERRLGELERGAGPVEAGNNLLLQNSDGFALQEQKNTTKLILCDDAFVLDHPTQGALDDPNLKLDKAYCGFENVVQETDYQYLATDTNDTALFAGQGAVIDYDG